MDHEYIVLTMLLALVLAGTMHVEVENICYTYTRICFKLRLQSSDTNTFTPVYTYGIYKTLDIESPSNLRILVTPKII